MNYQVQHAGAQGAEAEKVKTSQGWINKPFVRQAFEKYLECGIFAHARYGDCGHDYFVAFSYKGRGVCHSPRAQRALGIRRLKKNPLAPLRVTPPLAFGGRGTALAVRQSWPGGAPWAASFHAVGPSDQRSTLQMASWGLHSGES